MNGTILQFFNYQPIVYSGFDKFSIALAAQLQKSGYRSVFVYLDSMEHAPELARDCTAAGAEIVLLESGVSPLALLRQINQLFKRYRPSLVHAHFDDRMKIAIALNSLLFRVPLITSAHSELSPHYSVAAYRRAKGWLKTALFRSYFKFLNRASAYCFCVSRKVQQQFIAFAGPSDKIRALYLGVSKPGRPAAKDQLRKMLRLPQDKILITNVSAIEPIKGIDTIIAALHLLKHRYKVDNFHFCHIGGLRNGAMTDSYWEDQKRALQELELTSYFTWVGVRTDVLDILPAFDIYVQPSRKEGLPVSVMEACAVGLPCVGSNVSGIPEIIHHQENGYLIDQEGADELALHLRELIEDEERRLEMGECSRKIFARHFDLTTQVARTKDYYKTLLPA